MLQNTILIIHHDDIYRSTVAQFLSSDAYNVLQTDTVQAAYELLANQHIDVVILDLMLTQTEEVNIRRSPSY